MDWDDLRYFLTVARCKQMQGAAKRLGVSQALLSRHIASLEEAVGARLLNRTTRGCTLTEDGHLVFAMAERVEAEVFSGLSDLGGQGEVAGSIRVGAPDGFGGAYLAPRLGRINAEYPQLKIQLVPVPGSFSLSEREADIAIMVGRPKQGRLKVRKLIDYSLGVYASKEYLANNPAPKKVEALRSHTLVGYVDDLIHADDLNYTREFLSDWHSDIQVSTAIGQVEAVKAGAGIGVLHDFMAKNCNELVRLFPEQTVTRTYWIVWHESLAVVTRLRAFTDMLDTLVAEDRELFTNKQVTE